MLRHSNRGAFNFVNVTNSDIIIIYELEKPMSYQGKKDNWSKEFILTKAKFYHLKEWLDVRDEVRKRDRGKCQRCGKFIRSLADDSVVDHIIELSPDNFDDINIRLGFNNLQLLCKTCHNIKTFGKAHGFDLDARDNINLF